MVRNQKSKKVHYTILKHFTKQETVLTIIYEAKYKTVHGVGLKTLTPE